MSKTEMRKACVDLWRASQLIGDDIRMYIPEAPNVRPKVFRLCDGVSWPITRGGKVHWGEFDGGGHVRLLLPETLLTCLEMSGEDKREIIKRLNDATSWCIERFVNVVRHQAERRKKQVKAIDEIKMEVFLHKLSGGKVQKEKEITSVAVSSALYKLYKEQCALRDEMFDSNIVIRPRIFELCEGAYWPAIEGNSIRWGYVYSEKDGKLELGCNMTEELLIKHAGGKPSAIVYIVRQLIAAAYWCAQRTKGIKEHKATVAKQQEHIINLIKSRT
ncbi:MAG: hypothetical protein ONB06_02220 [candidate division KSB1 bacterium]|nr:hypothetical protein [candidate division KSB1 bacterium]